MKKKIALVTYGKHPELTDSDERLAQSLRRSGMDTVAAVWDDASVDWGNFDLIVLRSCWDYHLHPAEFRTWLEHLQEIGAPLYNPVRSVLWNMDKVYLRDLAQAGVATVPTVWLDQGEPASLEQILLYQHWEEAVVKPRIGASAYGTWQTTFHAARGHDGKFQNQKVQAGLMVQKLVREIAGGEWSIVFFRNRYSHAALKKPGTGQIFSQLEKGGSAAVMEPPRGLIDQASRVLQTAASLTLAPDDAFLYTRVDGIEVEGQLVLMELEIIEPDLFLDRVPPAADRFAQAVMEIFSN